MNIKIKRETIKMYVDYYMRIVARHDKIGSKVYYSTEGFTESDYIALDFLFTFMGDFVGKAHDALNFNDDGEANPESVDKLLEKIDEGVYDKYLFCDVSHYHKQLIDLFTCIGANNLGLEETKYSDKISRVIKMFSKKEDGQDKLNEIIELLHTLNIHELIGLVNIINKWNDKTKASFEGAKEMVDKLNEALSGRG